MKSLKAKYRVQQKPKIMLFLWICLGSLVPSALGARILAVVPFPGKSHQLFCSSVIRALSERGHHVVEYSPFPTENPIANHTYVALNTRFKNKLDSWNFDDLQMVSNIDGSLQKVRRIWNMNYDICEDTFQNENIKKLLTSNDHFDLVLTESSFGEESLLAFGHKFGAPTVTLETFFPWSVVNRDAGNSLAMAYAPELMPFVATDQMSFKERLFNCLSVLWTLYFYYNSHIPKQQAILNSHYPDAPPLTEIIANVSLYFINTQATAHYIRPFTPNIIPIGGIQINEERTQLPKNIIQFMDSASTGVIYFSLGTIVPAHSFPSEYLQVFINVFKTLPQKVIWKINLNTLPATSENVLVTKWVPQPGVLAHPNCVLFMTHGGLFSQQEAIHAGVPTVSIPFFADQPFNAKYNEHRGVGVTLDLFTLSEEKVLKALTTVLNNPSYKDNMRRLSAIYKDRPMSPADSLVFWVEYVLRHRGAHHLRPTSSAMSWYQLALLDVIVAVITILSLISMLFYYSLKNVISFCWHKKKNSTLKSKKKTN